MSRLSSAEVKGTILSEQMDVAELSSLSLPLHFPFNSLSLPASELAKVELLIDQRSEVLRGEELLGTLLQVGG